MMMTLSMRQAVDAFKTVYAQALEARPEDIRTVDEMDEMIHAARAELGDFAMAQTIEQAVAEAMKQDRCCGCGGTLEVHHRPALRVQSMQGTHEGQGVSLRCDKCKRTERPVHVQLGIEHYSKSTLLFERLSADFFLDKGAPTAVVRLKEHHGIEPGRTTLLQRAEDSGQLARTFLDKKLSLAADAAEARRGHQPRVDTVFVEMDSSSGKTVAPLVRPEVAEGAMVERTPVRELPKVQRPIEGRQVKLLCAQAKGETDWVYDAYIGEYEQAPPKLVGLAANRGWQDGVKAVMIADGDDKICEVAQGAFGSDLQMILDREHAIKHLRDVTTYGKDAVPSDSPEAWLAPAKSLLHTGRVRELIGQVRAIAPAVEDPKDRTKVDNVAIYFEQRARAVHYDYFKDQGWPLGSGAVEGGHIHFIHPITKRGSGWLTDHLNHIVALACVRQSGWWQEFWDWVGTRRRPSIPSRTLN
jgi:hypothetical protein